ATIMSKLQIIETVYSTETAPFLVIGNWAVEKAQTIKSKYLEAYAQMALGFAYLYTDNVTDKTGNHFTAALRISEANGYHDITAQTYNGLAHVYGMARQTEKYEEFTLKSIEASRKANLPQGIANGYAALASTTYTKRKGPEDVKKAIYFQQQSIDAAEGNHDSLSLIIYYLNISNYHAELAGFDSATYFLEKSKAIIDKKRSGNDNMSYHFWKGSMLYKKKDYTAAIQEYNTAISFAQKYKSRSFEIRTYRALIKAHKETGDFEKALVLLEATKRYDDSVFTKESFAKAADIQNKYEQEKKDNEITRLGTEQRIQQLQLEKQNAIIAGNLLEAEKKQSEIELLARQKEVQALHITEQDKELEKNLLLAKANAQLLQLSENEKELKEIQLSSQKQTRNILLAGLGLLGLLAVILLRNIQAKKKAYRKLEEKSIQIQEQALQLSKQARLIAQFQSQMNPHFVYNALHNIQGLVLSN
ncbi:MAG: histidine kinase, partial [Chitinophagaceae bacterium]|nr:histidine kinase [Chitinophagaceae bacterium]